MKELPILYNIKEECSGCTACYAVCPENAIVMVEDKEGFEYPTVDEKRCLKVCPFKSDVLEKS